LQVQVLVASELDTKLTEFVTTFIWNHRIVDSVPFTWKLLWS